MRSNWLRAFWPKPQEQDFSQILDLCKNKENNIFITEQISENCDQFFQIKKTLFFCRFPQFLEQKFFQKIGLSCTASSRFLAPWQNSEKFHDQIPRKHPDRCQEGRIDRPYFIGSLANKYNSNKCTIWA